jgi:hypothetical protein
MQRAVDLVKKHRGVTVDLDNLPLGEAIVAMTGKVEELNMKPGYQAVFGASARTLSEASNDFVIAIILSVAFIYMVLASQFGSFLHPFTIMLSLPLAFQESEAERRAALAAQPGSAGRARQRAARERGAARGRPARQRGGAAGGHAASPEYRRHPCGYGRRRRRAVGARPARLVDYRRVARDELPRGSARRHRCDVVLRSLSLMMRDRYGVEHTTIQIERNLGPPETPLVKELF